MYLNNNEMMGGEYLSFPRGRRVRSLIYDK